MSTKSNRSSGTQHTQRGVNQGVVLVDPKTGLPVDVVFEGGQYKLAVTGSSGGGGPSSDVNIISSVPLTLKDPVSGNLFKVNADGSIDANVEVDAADGDSIAVVGTEDGTPSGTQHTLKIGADGNARVKDDAANTTLQSIDSKLTSPITVTGPITDTELRASPVPISGTVGLDAPSLAALENINVTVTSSAEVEIKNDVGNPVPISAASLPLPSGAAIELKQDTGNTSLASIDSKLSNPLAVTGPLTDTQLRAAAVPVSGTFFPPTQPISATALPLPTGASNAALQTAANASLTSIDSKLTSPLTVTSDPIKGTENGLPAGPQFTFVNNRKQQILAAKDRDQLITYADFGTKNQRVTLIDYISPSIGTGAGYTARKTLTYVLDSGRYRRTNITWSLV